MQIRLIINQKLKLVSRILVFVICALISLSLQARSNLTARTHLSENVLINITGTVMDHTNSPLPGASIILKGTTKGVVTDTEGNFSIQADIGDVLVVSYIGMVSQELIIKNQNNISISLIADATTLGDVVVVGYGTQKKSEITSSIAKIDGKDLQTSTASNVALSLQGRASGVEIFHRVCQEKRLVLGYGGLAQSIIRNR